MTTTPPISDPRILAIRAAHEAADAVLAELLRRADLALTADAMADLQPEIERARSTRNDCRQKEIDLTAASAVIQPISPATAARLQSLAAGLDAAIVQSAVADAALGGIAAVLNSAVRINAIL